ncbi:MAG: T9SS type A sorting domain-containing protein [Bacteroidetes bacterium]|nr:MAG: T9SS type A sorting domain-containing protein [Bacteroidota bacterium]
MKHLITLLSLIISSGFLYSEWTWVNPLFQGDKLKEVRIKENNVTYAVGHAGVIMKSTDEGLTWQMMYIPINRRFNSIDISGQGDIVAVGDSGYVAYSSDGGKNWKFEKLSSGKKFNSVRFLNDDICYAVGDYGMVAYTDDRGNSWNQKQIWLLQGIPNMYSLCFTENKKGYISSFYGVILEFKGSNNASIIFEDESMGKLNSIFFLNDSVGFAVGDDAIVLKTTNGGSNWLKLYTRFYEKINSIAFSDENNGVMVSDSGKIINTTDGGVTWTFVLRNANESVEFGRNGYGIAVGQYGFINKTTDSGKTWEKLKKWYNPSFYSVSTIDINTCYLPTNNYILKTTDGGFTWIDQTPKSTVNHFSSIYCINSLTCFLGGRFGLNYKTTNGGVSWEVQHNECYTLKLIKFLNDNFGYALCSSTTLFKTTDGGNTWIDISDKKAWQELYSIFFINPSIGFAVGDDGTVCKTTDGGESWKYLNIGDDIKYWMNSVYFLNINEGFVVCDNGVDGFLLSTTDGGDNWLLIKKFNYRLSEITFVNDSVGFIIGGRGAIFKSTNRGKDWNQQFFQSELGLYSMSFSSQDVGYIVGDDGLIIKTTNGGEYSSVNDNDNIDKNQLLNFYPNPVDYIGTISYFIAKSSKIVIKVFDLTGTEIAELTNQVYEEGAHEIEYNFSNFQNGTYFFRIVDGNSYLYGKFIVFK